MTDQPPRPIPDSYWVRSGQLLAGEYPGAARNDQALQKLRRFLDAGVSYFLDLTEEDEYNLNPYVPVLQEEARARGAHVEHHRIPIPDLGTPTAAGMERVLNTVDGAIEAGHTVYVHCYGGIGRTGTVVGCYLVRHGMDGEEALTEIARLRAGTPDEWRVSPETEAQRAMVREWGG